MTLTLALTPTLTLTLAHDRAFLNANNKKRRPYRHSAKYELNPKRQGLAPHRCHANVPPFICSTEHASLGSILGIPVRIILRYTSSGLSIHIRVREHRLLYISSD